MMFFVLATVLVAIPINICYLHKMARAGSKSLAELLLLVAFDAGLIWIVAAQVSARPGF
jgi:hypothetical protein